MDVECRSYRYLEGDEDAPRLGTATARIWECAGREYRIELTDSHGGLGTVSFPTLARARQVVEERVAKAEAEIRRADCEARQRILLHPWWRVTMPRDDLDRILELASIHPEGVILIDPCGGYAWTPRETWHTGRHVRLEIPAGGHCTTSAAFVLLQCLEDALQLACPPAKVLSRSSLPCS